MQVLEDYDQCLVEALVQHDPLNSLVSASLPELPVHLFGLIVPLDDAEQTEEVWQGVFKASIERDDPSSYLLAPLAFVIPRRNVKIVAKQFDDRQVS